VSITETNKPRTAPGARQRGRAAAPRVSVLVPCYRYADMLEGCVASVLSQEAADVRVLIMDDCSPDHTRQVAEGLMERDSRVEYSCNSHNQGLIPTANQGFEWAAENSDYTVLLSADDQLVPGSLRRATTVMEAAPNVGMVYGWALYAHSGRPLPRRYGRWLGTKVWDGSDWIRLRCRSGYNCISSPEVVVRTSVQTAVGGFDPECTHSGDLAMWMTIGTIADIAHIRGAAQAIYRIHSDSMLRSDPSVLLGLRERRAAFESFFAQSGWRLEHAAELERSARRALARQALWRASRLIDRDLLDGPDSVDGLIEFALDVFPEAERLPEWRGLRVRRRLGAGRSQWFFPFLVTGAAHKAQGHLAQLQLRALGI
jgi:Glycosyl transferase family 2